jgi:hypothetical protein
MKVGLFKMRNIVLFLEYVHMYVVVKLPCIHMYSYLHTLDTYVLIGTYPYIVHVITIYTCLGMYMYVPMYVHRCLLFTLHNPTHSGVLRRRPQPGSWDP